jgi:hypothetical protein
VYEPLEYIETAGLEGTEQAEGGIEHTTVAGDEREPPVHHEETGARDVETDPEELPEISKVCQQRFRLPQHFSSENQLLKSRFWF